MAREWRQPRPNYQSGEDYVIEFHSFRYAFNRVDFSQRVRQAAMELGLADAEGMDEDAVLDLVRLVSAGSIGLPLSSLGDYLVETGDEVLHHHGESLVFWMRELLFRGAWLDMQIMEGRIEVAFNDELMEFAYYPKGHSTREMEMPPHPTWRDVAYPG